MGGKKVRLRLFVFVNMELSFIFSLALQFKGVDQKAVKDIPKERFTNTGATKMERVLYFKVRFSNSRNLSVLHSEYNSCFYIIALSV